MENNQELAAESVYLKDEDSTKNLASLLVPLLCGLPGVPPDTPVPQETGGRIHLRGDLGAGKTSFARAFLRAAGITGRIKSPSYSLLESYNLFNLYFYHLDFYRFTDPREWLDAGFRDILQKEAVVLIEWPERASGVLPPPDLDISLQYAEPGRQARLHAGSDRGRLWLKTITPHLKNISHADSHDARYW